MSLKPIFAAICFSLALFLLLFMVWPKYQDLKGVNREMERAQAQIEKSKSYVSDLEDFSDQLQRKKKGMDKIEAALPSKPGVPSLLNFLYGTAQDQGLLMKEVGGISESAYRGDIKKVNVSLVVSGSYSSFKNFLKKVEGSSRIIEVGSIDFNIPREESVPPRFEIKLSTYFYQHESSS